MKEKVSVGILIVGSLYWDESSARSQWRKCRLDMSQRTLVSAPIRYGRKSGRRGESYTVVFSHELNAIEGQFGVGIAVTCKHPILAADDLIAEAEYLWSAESNTEKRACSISATWGCVAVLPNPKKRNLDPLLATWAERVSGVRHYGRLERARGESELLTPTGTITIAWPRTKDRKSLDLDILLLTATCPTITDGRYPSSSEIARAWNTPDGHAHVNYFWNNRKNGIETFQDQEIEKYLASSNDKTSQVPSRTSTNH